METHTHGGCGHPTGMFDYHYDKWLESVKQTPATDSFLAEVRTNAIKSALNDCTECLDRDCIMDLLGISYEDAALREAGAMALHDALLRKGAQS